MQSKKNTPTVTLRNPMPIAVVVGLCAHGLAITRDLAVAGIPVVALEADRDLPGVRSKYADLQLVQDINGPQLIEALTTLATQLNQPEKPVLFLTNDNMVKTIAENISTIDKSFRLSWSSCHFEVGKLLKKNAIEERCQQVGINYPKTVFLPNGLNSLDDVRDLQFPIILKPTTPLSNFKTLIIDSDEWSNDSHDVTISTPVIAQEYLPGGDDLIRFGAIYFHNGEPLARFEGRKLRSRPLGHTTVAVSEPDDSIHQLAVRFFAGLELSGPVSLELKQAPNGEQTVIEPTVGRTDFWIGLCIANGVRFPLFEYQICTMKQISNHTQLREYIWINGERDPFAFFWILARYPMSLVGKRVRGVYVNWQDSAPAFVAIYRQLEQYFRAISRRLFRLLTPFKIYS